MTVVREKSKPEPSASRHECLTVEKIVAMRSSGFLPPSIASGLLHQLGTGCEVCWRAIDTARDVPPVPWMPTECLEIRMLWRLTVFPSERHCPSQRKAARRARSEPFGVFHLLLEELWERLHLRPALVITEGRYLEALLGDPPEDRARLEAWHDVQACLEMVRGVAWALSEEAELAAAALDRAAEHCMAGSGHADFAVALHVARAKSAFVRWEEVAIWREEFEAALALLRSEEEAPHRLEVLVEMGHRLAHAERWSEAHDCLLTAAGLAAGLAAEYPTLQLVALDHLFRLELQMSFERQEDPPGPGLFFNLAMFHHQQAAPLYERWGSGTMDRETAQANTILKFEGTRWATSQGLRKGWRRLEKVKPLNPLLGVELLGLAMVLQDVSLFLEHFPQVRDAFAASEEARGRLREFRAELLALREKVEEKAQVVVIDPWLWAVERLPIDPGPIKQEEDDEPERSNP